jgi:hypothetical protein
MSKQLQDVQAQPNVNKLSCKRNNPLSKCARNYTTIKRKTQNEKKLFLSIVLYKLTER